MKGTKLALLCAICMTLTIIASIGYAEDNTKETSISTVETTYPGLASGSLGFARLEELPDGILVRSGDYELKTDTLDSEISKVPASLQEALKKNAFFFLEQLVTKGLLLKVAQNQPAHTLQDLSTADEDKLLQDYFHEVVSKISVSDQEVVEFYENNKDLCGGTPLDQLKDQLKQYVLQEKQQNAVKEHIRTLGQRMPIVVSTSWTQEQAKLARDNPVDNARTSGLPSLVDFGASGCRPCDMMTPILDDLKKKFEGKLNVVFVHVQEEQILAARYGIQSIPVQVFFDKNGKEVFRHTGFFPQTEIEKKLNEIGVE
ncbi:MAG: thioredoxin [Candidatus Omnitrophota bacterium]|nr:MAG: thioredoxin [Candidatus Omnitrophota bacterium]